MDPLLFGLDTSVPQLVVAGFDGTQILLLSSGALADEPGAFAAMAAGWGPESAPIASLEERAARSFWLLRTRFVEPVSAPCEAVLVVPECVGSRARDALVRAAVRAEFTVRAALRPTEAIARLDGVRTHEGFSVVVSADLGHLEAAVFEGAPGLPITRACRGVSVGLGDLFVEEVVAWAGFTLDHRHPGTLARSPDWRAFVADAVWAGLATWTLGRPLTLATPSLVPAGGPAQLTLTADVLSLAFDDMVERVVAVVDEALHAAGVSLAQLRRVVFAGRQSAVPWLCARLSQRWKAVPCVAVEPGAAAQSAAVEAARMHRDSLRPVGSPRPSYVPASAPPSIPPLPPPGAWDASHPEPARIPSPPPQRPAATPRERPAITPPRERPAMPPPEARPSSRPPGPPSHPPASSSHPPQHGGAGLHARLPREGTFVLPASAASLRALPVVRPATDDEVVMPMFLASLLAQVGMRPHLTGTLVLRGEGDTVSLGIEAGTPYVLPGERARVLRAFDWKEGAFELLDDRFAQRHAAVREPMTGLVVAGLRPWIRTLPEGDLLALLHHREGLAPVLRPDRASRLQRMRLAASEERTVTRGFEAHVDLATHLRSASSMLRLLTVLELFEVLDWVPVQRRVAADPRDELLRRVERMRTQNHFEVLFVHWSVGAEEIAAAWQKFQQEYGPAGTWYALDRALCREALDRGAAAWAVLSKESSRLRHRCESYPTVDQSMLIPMIEARLKMLAYAKQTEEAEDMARLLREILSTAPPPAEHGHHGHAPAAPAPSSNATPR